MTAPDIFAVIDDVKTWLEPDASVPFDDADAKPVEYLIATGKAGVLFIYPLDEDHEPYEAGAGVRQNFRLVVDLAMDDAGESVGGVRLPVVTQAIRTRVAAYADRVRLHQHTTGFDYMRTASVDWQAINGQGFRGARLRLAGYRIWP